MIVVVGDRPCPRVGVGGAGVGIGIHAVPQMRLVTIAAPYGLRFGCCLLRRTLPAPQQRTYHYRTATTTASDDGGGASYVRRLLRCMFNEPSSRSSLSSFLFFCFLLIERSCCWVSFCPHTPDLWGRIGRLQQVF